MAKRTRSIARTRATKNSPEGQAKTAARVQRRLASMTGQEKLTQALQQVSGERKAQEKRAANAAKQTAVGLAASKTHKEQKAVDAAFAAQKAAADAKLKERADMRKKTAIRQSAPGRKAAHKTKVEKHNARLLLVTKRGRFGSSKSVWMRRDTFKATGKKEGWNMVQPQPKSQPAHSSH